jgi:hypothetical protein
MALQNPNNLYTAGAVVFNTQPSTNFAIQLMAQKKAKDEALDEYYRKLPQTINEAGMRDQDRPGFMQKVGEMQQFYLQHRDAIKDPRRDGGAAQYNFEKLYRGVKGYTEESKSAAKTALELGKLRFNKEFSYVFDDPDTIHRIQAHDLPIGSEGRADIDLHTLTIPPKPLGVEDWQRIDNTLTQDLTPGQTPTGKVETLPNFQVRKHYVKQFDPQSLATIGARAVSLYGTDRNIKGAANARFAQATPEEIALLNKVYEPLMKRPIGSPADLFAAERIVAHSQATPGYKDEDDKKAYADYRFGQQVALKRIPQATSGGGSGAGSGADAEFNDAFSVVARKVNTDKANGYTYTRFNALPAMTQNVLLKYARQNTGGDVLDYNQATMYIKPDDKGAMQLRRMEGTRPNFGKDPVVMDIGFLDVNFAQQADVKGKRTAVSKNNQPSAKKYKGLDKDGNPIFE